MVIQRLFALEIVRGLKITRTSLRNALSEEVASGYLQFEAIAANCSYLKGFNQYTWKSNTKVING